MSYWKKWAAATAIRSIKTMAETAVAIIGAAQFMGGVDWKLTASASLLSGIVTVLTCVAGIPEVPKDGEQ